MPNRKLAIAIPPIVGDASLIMRRYIHHVHEKIIASSDKINGD